MSEFLLNLNIYFDKTRKQVYTALGGQRNKNYKYYQNK
jgi:hypothetical protein